MTQSKNPQCYHCKNPTEYHGKGTADSLRYLCRECGRSFSIPPYIAPTNLPNRLRDLRRSRNLTQTDVAEILNTTKGTMSRIENGQVELTIERLFELANIYYIRPSQLLLEYELQELNK